MTPTKRICRPCQDAARKGLRVAKAVCSSCGEEKCQHRIRYSEPRIICAKCWRQRRCEPDSYEFQTGQC